MTSQPSLASNSNSPELPTPPRRLELAVKATMIYLVAAILLALPALAFGYGLLDLGDANGWWVGDPNANDDDYLLALPFALVSYAAVVPAAALATRAIGRGHGIRVRPYVLVGTGLLVSLLGFGALFFA